MDMERSPVNHPVARRRGRQGTRASGLASSVSSSKRCVSWWPRGSRSWARTVLLGCSPVPAAAGSQRRAARRDALGRGGHRARVRTPAPPRPVTHRADLDGRRRGPRACAAEDRRAPLADHDAALPAPGRRLGRIRRHSLTAYLRAPRSPKWSPTARCPFDGKIQPQAAKTTLTWCFVPVSAGFGWSGRQDLNLRPLDPQSVLEGPAPPATCWSRFGELACPPAVAGCVAVRFRCHPWDRSFREFFDAWSARLVTAVF